ncbi:MAG: RNA-guided endonuclease InsQ/TnpB family protein [Shewanella sp.]
MGRQYRKLEQQLGIAQRANKKYRVKAIHAKIRNRRKYDLHKYSRQLVNNNAAIFIGNVNSLAMTKTKLAKSVLDAGWGILKTMLEYKCAHAGVVFEEVNESYTTQTCSSCGDIPASSPKGRAGLRIREWTCSSCGATHSDRDINAAKNIYGPIRFARHSIAILRRVHCTHIFGLLLRYSSGPERAFKILCQLKIQSQPQSII